MTPTLTRPANPFLACMTCGGRVQAFSGAPAAPVNLPCGHRGGYRDLCPSWGPVDGCQCAAHLGHVPHPEVLR